MEPSPLPHVMLVSYPGQGHISPLLRLGTLIASKGLIVTFVTTEQPWGKKMRQANKIQEGVLKPVGLGFLRFEFFSDGLTDDDEKRTDFNAFRPNIEAVGKQEIKNLVKRYNKESVTCLINNAYVPWVCDVAEELQIPSAVLWVQSCACLSAYYYYHHGLVKFPTKTEPDIDVEIPCLPLLKHDEIPSFLHTSSPYTPYGEVILDQFKRLENDKPFYLFIDTFRELEKDIIDHMSNLCPQAIISPVGPLFKMAETISSDVKGDISEPASDCIEWLEERTIFSRLHLFWDYSQLEARADGGDRSWRFELWLVVLMGGRGEADKKIVSREVVVEKLLEATVGEKAVELRENALRWKEKAEAAVAYGGSSDRNFRVFVDKLVRQELK
ncbi:unnamed protein product [Arabidopsis lyrata]|nr:unnamed protein product [Arabidopsis lyrata]